MHTATEGVAALLRRGCRRCCGGGVLRGCTGEGERQQWRGRVSSSGEGECVAEGARTAAEEASELLRRRRVVFPRRGQCERVASV